MAPSGSPASSNPEQNVALGGHAPVGVPVPLLDVLAAPPEPLLALLALPLALALLLLALPVPVLALPVPVLALPLPLALLAPPPLPATGVPELTLSEPPAPPAPPSPPSPEPSQPAATDIAPTRATQEIQPEAKRAVSR
ncbi:hypothetical protein WME75_13145 [Sorangium sp. So ce1014]|uniref:hypothetical protein n=1 Tax=Sorangium sp. So ce1014 TaxID=3133326 RepID=UPI003F61BB69